MRWPPLFLFATLGLFGVGIGIAIYIRGTPMQPVRDIVAVRLQPPLSAGDEIECDSLSFVEFNYLIRNNTAAVIRGLQLDLSCGCQQTQPPPPELAPGEEARVSFRLSAPLAGATQRQVSLLAKDRGPVARFDVALRVRIDPPMLMTETHSASLTFVDGESSAHEFVVKTIEKADSEPWIQELRCSPVEPLRVIDKVVDELPLGDSALLQRAYRFTLTRRSLDLGRHTIQFTLATRDEANSPQGGVFHVNVVDGVTVVPPTLRLTTGTAALPKGSRVVVLFRSGEGWAEVDHYDKERIDVQPITKNHGRLVAFNVAPASTSPTTADTTVYFRLGDGTTRELKVQLVSLVEE